MELSFKILKADINDIPEIAGIHENGVADGWSVAALTNELNKSGSIILKAVNREGIICGYITAETVIDEVNIYNIAVREEYRRRGIAAALLREMFAQTVARVYLLEVRESNEPAVALYKSFGFEITGLRKNYYYNPYESAVLMTLTLPRE